MAQLPKLTKLHCTTPTIRIPSKVFNKKTRRWVETAEDKLLFSNVWLLEGDWKLAFYNENGKLPENCGLTVVN